MIEAYSRLNFFPLLLKAFNETNMNTHAGQEVALSKPIHAVNSDGLENPEELNRPLQMFFSFSPAVQSVSLISTTFLLSQKAILIKNE